MKSIRLTAAVAVVALCAACMPPGPIIDPPGTDPPTTAPSLPALGAVGDRWVWLSANLLGDDFDSVLERVRAMSASGADTVLFSDTKTSNWYASDYKDQWLSKVTQLQQFVRDQGMAFVVTTASVGYCAPILQLDPSLANSMPAVDMPMTVRNGQLVADQTASVPNGSFEASSAANVPDGWDFQDQPGVSTFIDTSVAANGSASMRLEGAKSTGEGMMARIATTASVLPNQQYVLRYKLKADAWNAGFIGPVVRGGDTEVTLTNQHPSLPDGGGGRRYFIGANNLTTDWVEQELVFNSREFASVRMYFGSWGTTSGTAWIDDVRIEPAPTLNVNRRASLPLTVTKADGTALTEGVDVSAISDPLLGNIAYTGNYDTYHDVPPISVPAGSSLAEGDRVLLSAYHATLTTAGQVGCSWNEPRTIELMKEMHRQVATVIKPDGIMIDIEETRTGGWEPTDAPFGTSAAAYGNHVNTAIDDAYSVAGDIPLFIWNDMLDPTMNAVANFYQVKGDLTGSWAGLDPSKVRVVNWRSGAELREGGPAGVKHFADLGFEQIVAGFYDEDVADNHAAWQTAVAGQPRIIGSMYTTWTEDYSKLGEFAALWWPS